MTDLLTDKLQDLLEVLSHPGKFCVKKKVLACNKNLKSIIKIIHNGKNTLN